MKRQRLSSVLLFSGIVACNIGTAFVTTEAFAQATPIRQIESEQTKSRYSQSAYVVTGTHNSRIASSISEIIMRFAELGDNESTTLERKVNRELGLPVTTDGNGNLVVESNGIQATFNNQGVISADAIEEAPIAYEFESVGEMAESAQPSNGDVIRTNAYRAGTGRGGATYDVMPTSESGDADGMSRIALANGLVAVIRAENGMVSVDQLGAHADNETDDAPYIQAAVDLGYRTVAFEGDDYRINRQLELRHGNLTILGNGATLHYYDRFVWDASRTDGDYAIGVQDRTSGNTIENVYIQGLNLTHEKVDDTTNYGHNMIRIANAEHVELYDCDLVAQDNSNGGERHVITNIDLRTYWYDVIIDSCELINNTHSEAGGTIWIRAGRKGTGKLVMRNNHIEKSCHDESIALFGNGSSSGGARGYVDDVTIERNDIDIDEDGVRLPSAPVFNFGMGTLGTSNVRFRDNDIDVRAAGTFVTVSNTSDVDISGNDFNITLLHRTDVDGFTGSIFHCDDSQSVAFDGNTIGVTATDDTQMGYFARGFDRFCDNDIRIDAPIGAMFQNCVRVDDNRIDIATSDIRNKIWNYTDKESYPFLGIYAWHDDATGILSFCGNEISFEKQLGDSDVRLVALDGMAANGNSVYVTDNIVRSADGQDDANKHLLSVNGCTDTDVTTTIYVLDNDTGIYRHINISGNVDDSLYKVKTTPEHIGISLTMTANPTNIVEPVAGETTINYGFMIENTGVGTLHSVVLTGTTFDGGNAIAIDWSNSNDPSTDEGTLSSGETVTATAAYTITQDDIDTGSVTSWATVTGENENCRDAISDEASVKASIISTNSNQGSNQNVVSNIEQADELSSNQNANHDVAHSDNVESHVSDKYNDSSTVMSTPENKTHQISGTGIYRNSGAVIAALASSVTSIYLIAKKLTKK